VLVFDVWHPDLTDREASLPSQLTPLINAELTNELR